MLDLLLSIDKLAWINLPAWAKTQHRQTCLCWILSCYSDKNVRLCVCFDTTVGIIIGRL